MKNLVIEGGAIILDPSSRDRIELAQRLYGAGKARVQSPDYDGPKCDALLEPGEQVLVRQVMAEFEALMQFDRVERLTEVRH